MKTTISTALLSFLMIVVLVACGGQAPEAAVEPEAVDVTNIADTIDVQTANVLRDNPDVVLIDVREQWEYDEGHIPGITLIPMSEIENRLSEIPTDKEVVLTCRSGNRSGQVHAYLQDLGYENTHNMQGGIIAWESAGLPVER